LIVAGGNGGQTGRLCGWPAGDRSVTAAGWGDVDEFSDGLSRLFQPSRRGSRQLSTQSTTPTDNDYNLIQR